MRGKVGVALFLVVALTGAGYAGGDDTSDLPDEVREIMGKKRYRHGTWALVVADAESGDVEYSLEPDTFMIPGSNAKLYSMSAALDTLGPDHRFETPVYATGPVDGPTVAGDLVLVASGDLVLGGRGATEGTIAYENFDHNDANALPIATLTPQDPLAGLDALASQVAAAGVTTVAGDVLIDDRLFETDTEMNPETPTTPIMVNENVIDLLTTPSQPGQPAEFTSRPQTAAYQVTSSVTTVEAGGTTDVEVDASGNQITVSGTIAADADPLLKVQQVADPAAFARTAFVEALARAGVTVGAPATGPNPTASLPDPASYAEDARLAVLESPPFRDYLTLVMKVSLNLGANLAICLLAVESGSTDCDDGFGVLKTFLEKAGVNPTDVAFTTGQGGKRSDLVTPTATTDLVRYWTTTDDFEVFKDALPILGVDGSLTGVADDTPAKGKVFAKTGTLVDADLVNQRFLLGSKALGGYMRANGRLYVFGLYVNDGTASAPNDVLAINEDLGQVAAALRDNL
jgi:serine-type D-Ala-D-Ala carboxypeptidase/endopeptidase (penicillin-binding protein 4)